MANENLDIAPGAESALQELQDENVQVESLDLTRLKELEISMPGLKKRAETNEDDAKMLKKARDTINNKLEELSKDSNDLRRQRTLDGATKAVKSALESVRGSMRLENIPGATQYPGIIGRAEQLHEYAKRNPGITFAAGFAATGIPFAISTLLKGPKWTVQKFGEFWKWIFGASAGVGGAYGIYKILPESWKNWIGEKLHLNKKGTSQSTVNIDTGSGTFQVQIDRNGQLVLGAHRWQLRCKIANPPGSNEDLAIAGLEANNGRLVIKLANGHTFELPDAVSIMNHLSTQNGKLERNGITIKSGVLGKLPEADIQVNFSFEPRDGDIPTGAAEIVNFNQNWKWGKKLQTTVNNIQYEVAIIGDEAKGHSIVVNNVKHKVFIPLNGQYECYIHSISCNADGSLTLRLRVNGGFADRQIVTPPNTLETLKNGGTLDFDREIPKPQFDYFNRLKDLPNGVQANTKKCKFRIK